MEGYFCKACHAPATVDESGVKRTCACNTTVVAGMSAHARGAGAVNETGLVSRFLGLVKAAGRRYVSGRV